MHEKGDAAGAGARGRAVMVRPSSSTSLQPEAAIGCAPQRLPGIPPNAAGSPAARRTRATVARRISRGAGRDCARDLALRPPIAVNQSRAGRAADERTPAVRGQDQSPPACPDSAHAPGAAPAARFSCPRHSGDRFPRRYVRARRRMLSCVRAPSRPIWFTQRPQRSGGRGGFVSRGDAEARRICSHTKTRRWHAPRAAGALPASAAREDEARLRRERDIFVPSCLSVNHPFFFLLCASPFLRGLCVNQTFSVSPPSRPRYSGRRSSPARPSGHCRRGPPRR